MSNFASITARSFATSIILAALGAGCAAPDGHMLRTQVDIDAPAEVVWQVLVDFEGHADWDPFFSHLEGDLQEGSTLDIVIGDPADGGMAFQPEVLHVEEAREPRWIGHLVLPGVFDGEHAFMIVENDAGSVTLFHEEIFTGPMVPFFWEKLDTETRAGFHDFNAALKARAEGLAAPR
jgi:hypothetical protein